MKEAIPYIADAISIILALYAIFFAKNEAKKSRASYESGKETLREIESKSNMIDRAVQVHQAQLVDIINKSLDKIGFEPIELTPITKDEIDAIFEEDIGKKEKETKRNLSNNRYLQKL